MQPIPEPSAKGAGGRRLGMRKLLIVLMASGLAITLAGPAFGNARDSSHQAKFTAQRDRDRDRGQHWRGHGDYDGRRGYSRDHHRYDDYYGRGYYRHRYGYYYGSPYYYDGYYGGYYGYPAYYRDSPSRQRECYDAYYYDRDFWYRYCQGGSYRGYQATDQTQSPTPDQMNTAPGDPAPAADQAAPMTPAPDPHAAPAPDPNMGPAPEPVAKAPGSDTGYPTVLFLMIPRPP